MNAISKMSQKEQEMKHQIDKHVETLDNDYGPKVGRVA